MNKSILISIRPEHAVHILNGNKPLELRKNIPADFENITKEQGGIWVNIYVTKGKPYLYRINNWRDDESLYPEFNLSNSNGEEKATILNGKVVARFWLDEYEKISFFREYKADGECGYCYMQSGSDRNITRQSFLNKACISEEEIIEWNNDSGKPFYAWHIKNLEIFNKPKDLWDFHTRHDMIFLGRTMAKKVFQFESVNKAPQSWQYVWRETI